MKLTNEQLRKFGIKFINQLRDESKEDKPFGSDEWPWELAKIAECKDDDESPDWSDVDKVFSQLFELFENALPKKSS